MEILRETALPLPIFKKGKVRDLYDLEERLLIVSTDRISAFDVVLPTPIPFKGLVLNKLSEFWFRFTEDLFPNHLLSADPEEFPQELRGFRELAGRSMLVKKTKPLPVEWVVRGYLYGSAWEEYRRKGSVCGTPLPPGLRMAEKLPEPLLTPTTKEAAGHDRPLTTEQTAELVGRERMKEIMEGCMQIYERACWFAEHRGIIIADTKMEFGLLNGEVLLIDELLTPDSSRFWPADSYEPGKPQPSFDKQYVRDYLESTGWNKQPPAPELPPEVVKKTTEKYLEALGRLTS
jgi:phosphoribosylaminoimidazole-succinocarboxamide synthase